MMLFRRKPKEGGESNPGPQQPERRPVESLKTSGDIFTELALRRDEAAMRADPARQIADARKAVEAALNQADIKPQKDPKTLEQIKKELNEKPAPPPLSPTQEILAELERRRQAKEDREGPSNS